MSNSHIESILKEDVTPLRSGSQGVGQTPLVNAATYAGWIKVDDGTDSPWHTDRQEWTKADVARKLETDRADLLAALKELADAAEDMSGSDPDMPSFERDAETFEDALETARAAIANAQA